MMIILRISIVIMIVIRTFVILMIIIGTKVFVMIMIIIVVLFLGLFAHSLPYHGNRPPPPFCMTSPWHVSDYMNPMENGHREL